MIIKQTLNVKIQHETMGILLDKTFDDKVQFKLFLKMIQGCLTLENDLTHFNGEDFLLHVPFKILKNSLILTQKTDHELVEHIKTKQKL